jgi:DNA helicase HerA-like ATPase
MGTFLVHRLINPIDQDLIKKAIGDLDSTTAQALPTLATGEVLLLGVDFNFPMRIKINKAKAKIESASTNFSKVWKENKDR